MLYHENLSILLVIIVLAITESYRYNKIKKSKIPITTENWQLLVTIHSENPSNICEFFAGMLIRKNWILTSAKTSKNSTTKDYLFVKSKLLETQCNVRAFKMYAKARFIHPEFSLRKFFTVGIAFHDVSVIKLAIDLPYCQIPKLRLPSRPAKTGTECITIAWDKDYNGKFYEELETVVSVDECKKVLTENFGMKHITIGPMHFCTKSKNIRSGVMVSGQPLMCNNRQYGIANLPNIQPNYSIWTRTDLYIDWINEIIPENDDETINVAQSNDYGFLNDYR